jgi:GTP cyclohydrolase I
MMDVRNDELERLFRQVVDLIDPEPERSGLIETPARMAKAWREWTGGHRVDIPSLFKSFDDYGDYDELIVCRSCIVNSICEHHGAPIIGVCHLGYLPDKRIVGLSKIPRLIDAFSRRLQVQERLTVQIAKTFENYMKPRAVGVIIKAEHLCMSTRGVRLHNSVTVTSCMRGLLEDDDMLRREFLTLVGDEI